MDGIDAVLSRVEEKLGADDANLLREELRRLYALEMQADDCYAGGLEKLLLPAGMFFVDDELQAAYEAGQLTPA